MIQPDLRVSSLRRNGSKWDLAREAGVKTFASLCLYWNEKTVSGVQSEGIQMDFLPLV